jgi:hypothetical protein
MTKTEKPNERKTTVNKKKPRTETSTNEKAKTSTSAAGNATGTVAFSGVQENRGSPGYFFGILPTAQDVE